MVVSSCLQRPIKTQKSARVLDWSKTRQCGPAIGGPVSYATTFLRLKSPPHALPSSETALPTALTQELPRWALKVPAQAHWPSWQRSRCSSGMLRTAVDDGVVDLGRFSCMPCPYAHSRPGAGRPQVTPRRPRDLPLSGARPHVHVLSAPIRLGL